MYKIRLLILLLISYTINACTNGTTNYNFKTSVAYIGGEFDGLILSNQLKSQLNNLGIFDKNSKFEIQADISHTQDLFITNIDKTSDREKISSSINLRIFNKESNCFTFTYSEMITQFYVLASSDQFISNNTAVEEIKIENTEYLVKKFINSLSETSFVCHEQ